LDDVLPVFMALVPLVRALADCMTALTGATHWSIDGAMKTVYVWFLWPCQCFMLGVLLDSDVLLEHVAIHAYTPDDVFKKGGKSFGLFSLAGLL
jgi:hypothetical protein